MTIIGLQLIVPLLLILWLALRPAKSRAGWLLQILATVAYLAAIGLAGEWLALPRWLAWLWLALFALAALFGPKPDWGWPRHWAGWVALPAWAALFILSVAQSAEVIRGLALPVGPVADIPLPLPPGRYAVADGGARVSMSAHLRTIDPETLRRPDWRGQAYAIDLVALDAWHRQAPGLAPDDPRVYAIWNRPVLAPCTGRVLIAADGRPDLPVPHRDLEAPLGNHVLLRCPRFDLLLAHFRKGSVAVRAGQTVRRGQKLGRVGSSGNSGAPHLHLGAQTPGPPGRPFGGAPLPLRVSGRYLVRGERL